MRRGRGRRSCGIDRRKPAQHWPPPWGTVPWPLSLAGTLTLRNGPKASASPAGTCGTHGWAARESPRRWKSRPPTVTALERYLLCAHVRNTSAASGPSPYGVRRARHAPAWLGAGKCQSVRKLPTSRPPDRRLRSPGRHDPPVTCVGGAGEEVPVEMSPSPKRVLGTHTGSLGR